MPRRSAPPSRRPSPASGRSSLPPRSRLAAVAPEERSSSNHQIANGLFVERRRFVPVTTTRRLAAALVRGRSNPGEAVELFVEVGARVIGAMGPDERDPCPRLALERDDHPVLAPQVPNAQPLQGIRPGDPVAERCAAAPGRPPSARRRSSPQVDATLHGVVVDLSQLLLREAQVVERGQVLLQLVDATRADQHRGHSRVPQCPRDG